MRPCEECTACCTYLIGSAFGHEFGGGNSCKFLCEKGCDVYRARPKTCESYFCAWAQELLSEEMRPDKCGVLSSVENGLDGQYLRLSFTQETINTNILDYFKQLSEELNITVVYPKDNHWEVL